MCGEFIMHRTGAPNDSFLQNNCLQDNYCLEICKDLHVERLNMSVQGIWRFSTNLTMFFFEIVFFSFNKLPTEILRLLFTVKKVLKFLEYNTHFSPLESSHESMATPCP